MFKLAITVPANCDNALAEKVCADLFQMHEGVSTAAVIVADEICVMRKGDSKPAWLHAKALAELMTGGDTPERVTLCYPFVDNRAQWDVLEVRETEAQGTIYLLERNGVRVRVPAAATNPAW